MSLKAKYLMNCNNNIVVTISIIVIPSFVASFFSFLFLFSFPLFFFFYKPFLVLVPLSGLWEHLGFCLFILNILLVSIQKKCTHLAFSRFLTSHALLSSVQSVFGFHHSIEIAFIKVCSDPLAKWSYIEEPILSLENFYLVKWLVTYICQEA